MTELMEAPVLGPLSEQPPWRRLTNFKEFDAACGVSGLAQVKGNDLEILAVVSNEPGRGHFRFFVDECKKEYGSIRFWALMNPRLEKILTRYGFSGGQDVDQFGGMCDVMDWNKPK